MNHHILETTKLNSPYGLLAKQVICQLLSSERDVFTIHRETAKSQVQVDVNSTGKYNPPSEIVFGV